MDERFTVCLIGPTSGGKSSILATLVDCVTIGAHGFPPDYRFNIQEITETEFTSGQIERPGRILDARGGDYEKLRRDFGSAAWGATEVDDTFEYFFRLQITRRISPQNGSSAQTLLRVIDAGGEIATPQDGAGSSVTSEVVDKFSDQISAAEGLIFAVPSVNLSHARWIRSLSELMDRLATRGSGNLKRIMVAFTQYERLFVQLGPSAFRYAVDPRVALHIVRKCVETASWLQKLRALETQIPPVAVRFTVTSSFGFARRYDNPNIDPHQPGEVRFRTGASDARYTALWRPFLTAEPFLWAAVGEDTGFTFSFADILGGDETVAAPEPTESPPPPPAAWRKWLSRLIDSFDINRR
jgi:hypothetical protein